MLCQPLEGYGAGVTRSYLLLVRPNFLPYSAAALRHEVPHDAASSGHGPLPDLQVEGWEDIQKRPVHPLGSMGAN